MVRCPWHGWEYDLRTGQSWFDPASVLVRRYDVLVTPGSELQKGPYVAETFPVVVDQEYVLVEIGR
jgi:3-phenylpropionate/trans-cinnamate dioxygenase ferredoxin subunit